MIRIITLDPGRVAVYDGDTYLGTIHQAVSGRWRWSPDGPTFETCEEAIQSLVYLRAALSPREDMIEFLVRLQAEDLHNLLAEVLDRRGGGSIMLIREVKAGV